MSGTGNYTKETVLSDFSKPARELLLRERQTLIDYAQDKFNRGDWHGVRDATVDIELKEMELTLLYPDAKL